MTAFDEHATPLFDQQEEHVEQVVETFEKSWQDHQFAMLDKYCEPSAKGLLEELVETDLEMRCRCGISVEDYLRRYPQLASDEDRLAQLVFAEFRIRSAHAEPPALATYLRQFPQLRERLLKLAEARTPQNEENTPPPKLTRDFPNTWEQDRYKVLERLDSGGRGTVWIAHDQLVDRIVCLKQIRAALSNDENSMARFLDEAHLTGQLEHPSIVPIYGIGTNSNGLPFYSMRLVRGVSLKQKIRETHSPTAKRSADSALARRELLSHFLAVCNAIHYAHEQGVIHRDLKPANVMVGDYGETFVVDWGLAKGTRRESAHHEPTNSLEDTTRVSLDRTVDGSIIGSPSYMSPEQAAGEEADERTDVYGLGAILYEILTGTPPATGSRATQLVADIRDGAIRPPRLVCRSTPPPLESICLRALAKNRTDRYPTARALSRDVEQYLADQPVDAHRESLSERTGRFARNHRGIAASVAAAMTIVTCVALTAAVAVNAARTRSLQSEARTQRVLEFVTDVFNSSRAENRGKDVTVAEAILDGLEKADQHLADDPIAHAKVLSTFGRTLANLGLYAEAQRACEQSYEILASELGQDDLQTLIQRVELAEALLMATNTEAAIPIFAELHKEFVARFGATDEKTLRVAGGLGRVYAMSGDISAAIATLESTYRAAQAIDESGDMTMTLCNNLALAYRKNGDRDKANRLLDDVVKKRSEIMGEDHVYTANVKYNKAVSLIGEDQLDEAIEMLEEVLVIQRRALPEKHANVSMAHFALATAHAKAGDTAAAIPVMEEAIQLLTETHGPSHNYTIQGHSVFGHALEVDGQWERALQEFDSVIDFTSNATDNPMWHGLHRDTVDSIVRLLLKGKKYTEAKSRAEEFVDAPPGADPKQAHRIALLLQTGLGEALLKLGESERAREELEQALSHGEEVPEHELAYARSCAAAALTRCGEYERAEQLLLQAQEQFEQPNQPVELSYRLSDNRNRLVALYEAWDKPESADAYRTIPEETPVSTE